MSRLRVDTGASKYFIDNNLNSILRNLDSEMSDLISLRSRLGSLNMYYSSNNNILNNLNSALSDIRYDYDALARFINNYRALINEIESVDSNLAAKFKKEVKEYCKSNRIETTEWYDKALDYLQIALDVVGFIPVFGEVADLANALVSVLRGNWIEAGICLVAMIPLVGDSFKALKYTDEAAVLLKYGDEVVDMGVAVLKQGSKKASTKASKEFAEKAIKDTDAAKSLLHKTMDMGNGDFYIKNTDGIDFKFDLNKNDIPTGIKDSIVAGCFLGETKVKTEDGFVAIKDIEEGNKVLTVNEETGQEEYKEVKKVFIRSGNEICIIKAGNDIIKATTGHLFKVKDKWWTAAINIEKGDYICTDDNKYLQVDDILVEKNNYPSFVYNLSVEENHNYFVGEEKILAHNMANMKSCTQGIEGVSKADNFTTIRKVTAEETNSWWKNVMGYDNPPYKPGTMVEEIKLTKDTTFVRVYDGEVSGMYGGWVMKAEDIAGLTPKQIQDKFALPSLPKYMADVKLTEGTTIRKGIVNPLEGWGNGGGIQYDLMGQRVGEFLNPRELP